LDAVADAIEQRDRVILRALRGDSELQKRNEPVPSSINDRVRHHGGRTVLAGEADAESSGRLQHCGGGVREQLGKLHTLVEVDLAKLEKDMEAAGAPWTPGRVPEWSEK
jgi:hypothetical protein